MRVAAVLAVLAALAGLVVGCGGPKSIAFEPDSLVIETAAGAPMPKVVVKDGDGKPIADAPRPTLTADEGVRVDGDTIVPEKNGATTITATLKGVPPARLNVDVRVIDKVEIECPAGASSGGCKVQRGGTLKLVAKPMGFDAPVEREVVWTSSSAAVAFVDGGNVTGVTPGVVSISAMAAGKSGSVNVEVLDPSGGAAGAGAAAADAAAEPRMALFCPSPPSIVVATKLTSGPSAPPACEIDEDDTVALGLLEIVGNESKDISKLAEWSSDEARRVGVDKGVMKARLSGGSTIRVKYDTYAATLPVKVRAKRAACADEASWTTPAAAKLKVDRDGKTVASVDEKLMCASANTKACIDGGMGAIDRAAGDGPANAAGHLVTLAVKDLQRRCCCKPG